MREGGREENGSFLKACVFVFIPSVTPALGAPYFTELLSAPFGASLVLVCAPRSNTL